MLFWSVSWRAFILLAIVAISTVPWFESVEVVAADENPETDKDNKDENTTDTTSISNNDITTTASTEVYSTAEEIFLTQSGLWYVCHREIENTDSEWTCINSLVLIAQLQQNQLTYFQSLIAFELISSIATLTGCLVALAAMVQEQPLAVLVAGFTMFFSGMFMLVGHLMMLYQHRYNDDEMVNWEYGYSFKLAWSSFVLCLITGIIDFIVYRNFRKITEEMMLGTVPAPSAKYVTRPSPVDLQASI
ncbi:uncharacterized protein [Amphiura filiformis]|uniref:uncharacterized protein n=1 Tax=Amphiura filiformis TaxID=82378 RepID=UPI003B2264DB